VNTNEAKIDEAAREKYTTAQLRALPKEELEAILRHDATLNGEKEVWETQWVVGEVAARKCLRCGHVNRAAEEPYACNSEICGGRKGVWKSNPKPIYTFPAIDFPTECEMQDVYSDLLTYMESYLCLPDRVFMDILALWILGTWKFHRFSTYPYLFFTGEIGSGKTTGLELLQELCYHPALMVAPTPAVVSRLCNEADCTILLDEAQTSFNQKTERGADMYSLWMSGYKRGQTYRRAKQGKDEGVVVREVFTPKAYASTRAFDPALQSRSIRIDMLRGRPAEKIDKKSKIEFKRMRSKLLWWHFSADEWIYPQTILHGRSYEVWYPICVLARQLDRDIEPLVKLGHKDEEILQEDLRQSLKGEIGAILVAVIEGIEEKEEIYLKEIADNIGDEMTPQRAGYILKDLGIRTKRVRGGTVVIFNEETVKKVLELKRVYGL
jgi:hypothetical protein